MDHLVDNNAWRNRADVQQHHCHGYVGLFGRNDKLALQLVQPEQLERVHVLGIFASRAVPGAARGQPWHHRVGR